MSTALIIPAAGRGDRLDAGMPKALYDLAGEPLLVHAVRAGLASGAVDLVAVAAPPAEVERVRDVLAGWVDELIVVAGGASRRESVAAALAALPADVDVVLVHDAARCLAPATLFAEVAREVTAGAAGVVPAVAVADTVKEVDGDTVVATLDRSVLRAVQTPQGFTREALELAHADAAAGATDDAGMVERIGHQVRVVPGDDEAFKITRPLDLLLAEAVLARRNAGGS